MRKVQLLLVCLVLSVAASAADTGSGDDAGIPAAISPGGAAANPLSALALLCGRAELFRIPPQQLSNDPSI